MSLVSSIEKASKIVGGQAKLAEVIGVYPTHLSNMKQGTRPCTLDKRIAIAQLAGDDPYRAVIEGLAAQLSDEDEIQAGAKKMLQAMLDAFPAHS